MGPPGMMAAGGMGMDYYNQLMQQQMMMYQQQIEYQRVYQEQTQAKYRIIMGLYTELQSLQMRLQQAYQGLYFGGAFSVGPGGGMMGPGGMMGAGGTSPGGQLPPPPPGGR